MQLLLPAPQALLVQWPYQLQLVQPQHLKPPPPPQQQQRHLVRRWQQWLREQAAGKRWHHSRRQAATHLLRASGQRLPRCHLLRSSRASAKRLPGLVHRQARRHCQQMRMQPQSRQRQRCRRGAPAGPAALPQLLLPLRWAQWSLCAALRQGPLAVRAMAPSPAVVAAAALVMMAPTWTWRAVAATRARRRCSGGAASAAALHLGAKQLLRRQQRRRHRKSRAPRAPSSSVHAKRRPVRQQRTVRPQWMVRLMAARCARRSWRRSRSRRAAPRMRRAGFASTSNASRVGGAAWR